MCVVIAHCALNFLTLHKTIYKMSNKYRYSDKMFHRRVDAMSHHATLKSVVKEIIKPV